MKDYTLPSKIIQLLTPDQVRHYGIIAVKQFENELLLNHKISVHDLKIKELSIVLDYSLKFEQISEHDFDNYVAFNYRIGSTSKITKLNVTDDVFENIVSHAYQVGASDIHIEPLEKHTRIRYRIDGALKKFYQIPEAEHSLLVNKIKIKSNLNISEKRRFQDGRINQKIAGVGQIDIRVSTLPSLNGEKVVMRLLESNQENLNISKIGMTVSQLEIYKRAYHKTNGIILISGPTGSGKTTTLYATLKELNQEVKNVLTVEDPIEYTLEGVNQVQVKHDIGFDFASALKTFLRQDPDIIMVGEIRDKETAQMAVKASLTGHLVLSTIHTNSALGTINRLRDMGIPNYLIASTLNLSVAQRLMRLLCESCKKQEVSNVELFDSSDYMLKTHSIAVGCDNCHFTGYKGRTALFEIIEMNGKIADIIKNNESNFDSHIDWSNFSSIKKQAILLLKEQRTSYEEIYPLLID